MACYAEIDLKCKSKKNIKMYIHTREYYPSIGRNEVLIHATMQMNLKKHYAEQKEPDTKDHTEYD